MAKILLLYYCFIFKYLFKYLEQIGVFALAVYQIFFVFDVCYLPDILGVLDCKLMQLMEVSSVTKALYFIEK